MPVKVAVIAAGIIGITTAIYLLEKKLEVTIFTKDHPLNTNSDAAVATWFAPDDSRSYLQELCIKSLPKFNELSKFSETGVKIILVINYLKSEEDFKKSAWAKESLKTLMEIKDITQNPPAEAVKNKDFPALLQR